MSSSSRRGRRPTTCRASSRASRARSTRSSRSGQPRMALEMALVRLARRPPSCRSTSCWRASATSSAGSAAPPPPAARSAGRRRRRRRSRRVARATLGARVRDPAGAEPRRRPHGALALASAALCAAAAVALPAAPPPAWPVARGAARHPPRPSRHVPLGRPRRVARHPRARARRCGRRSPRCSSTRVPLEIDPGARDVGFEPAAQRSSRRGRSEPDVARGADARGCARPLRRPDAGRDRASAGRGPA